MPTNWDNLVISFLKKLYSKRKKKKNIFLGVISRDMGGGRRSK